MEVDFIVRVNCMTYNQAPYIEDAMNGFCMQETSFPFVCIIMDDASTDGEQEVIKRYLQEHFDLQDKTIVRNEETDDYVMTFARHKTNINCYFAVFFLKYNHYRKKSKAPYIQKWANTRYVAFCEGDDYWIKPAKLQIQVDILEQNPVIFMTCNRSQLYSENKKNIVGEIGCYSKSQTCRVKDVVLKGGAFISTCSILFRRSLYNDYPDYIKKFHVGDYPLQIQCAMKGSIFYINEPMSVYRIDNPNSWMRRNRSAHSIEKVVSTILSETELMLAFIKDNGKYKNYFEKRIKNIIISSVPYERNSFMYYKQQIVDRYTGILGKRTVFFINPIIACLYKRFYVFCK